MTEDEHAQWRLSRGARILYKQDRYWIETTRGFFQGVHWMARMPIDRVSRPSSLCWGYRTTLDEESAAFANATMPVHLLRNVRSYDLQSLNPRQRNKLRNCHKQLEIVELTGPEVLSGQGYPVYTSARQRTGYGARLTRASYRDEVRRFFQPGGGLILAGLLDGRLVGYLSAYSVAATAYIEEVCLHTDHLKTNVSLALFFAVTQACRRSEQIRELVHGIHTPENDSLCRHKESLGFAVINVPARAWFLPPTQHLVKRLKPAAYYRLTGYPTNPPGDPCQNGLATSEF